MPLPLAGLARAAKLGIIDAQGKVTRSEIYFTNVETEEEVHLSMTPEKSSGQDGGFIQELSNRGSRRSANPER